MYYSVLRTIKEYIGTDTAFAFWALNPFASLNDEPNGDGGWGTCLLCYVKYLPSDLVLDCTYSACSSIPVSSPLDSFIPIRFFGWMPCSVMDSTTGRPP